MTELEDAVASILETGYTTGGGGAYSSSSSSSSEKFGNVTLARQRAAELTPLQPESTTDGDLQYRYRSAYLTAVERATANTIIAKRYTRPAAMLRELAALRRCCSGRFTRGSGYGHVVRSVFVAHTDDTEDVNEE